ncbi:MAG: hypothetical protein IJ529_03940 [Alphaproteobacteria bacterium]|nr:hypothetical protein [Alphaproteobacteria bacterium]
MSFVIFDTEYTSWKGCQEKGWSGARKKEIVQIAALKVTEDLQVIAEFNKLCRPVINPILSDYFVNLTHITNEMISQEGILFEKAFTEFKEFVGQNTCFSHGWGADFEHKSDGAIIDENIDLYHLRLKNDIKYFNIAPFFQKVYEKKKLQIKSQASGDIASLLGLGDKLVSLHLQPHDAFYDVYSILEGVRYLREDILPLMKICNVI